MKQLFIVLIAATSLSVPTFAQTQSVDHPAHHPAEGVPVPADMADGEVRHVDRTTGRITLRHGPIRNLDMPPMTMVFQVGDPALLDRVKQGDKVRFAAVEKSGAYIITRIEPAQ
jgi:Cu(I)/Ag(I) efflux system protein CusF